MDVVPVASRLRIGQRGPLESGETAALDVSWGWRQRDGCPSGNDTATP